MKADYLWLIIGSFLVTCVHAETVIDRRDNTTTSSSGVSTVASTSSTTSTKSKASTTKSTTSKTTTTKASTTTKKSTSSITSTSTALNDQCIFTIDNTKINFYYGQQGQTCSYPACLGNCGTYNEYNKCSPCVSKCTDAYKASQNNTCWPKYTACMDNCDPFCGGEKSDFGTCGKCVDKCSADLDLCETKAGLKACACLNKCASSNCKKCKSTTSLTATSTSTSTSTDTSTLTA